MSLWLRCLLLLHAAHAFTYYSTSADSDGQWKFLLSLSTVFSLPRCPEAVLSCASHSRSILICLGTRNNSLSSQPFQRYHRTPSLHLCRGWFIQSPFSFTWGDCAASASLCGSFPSFIQLRSVYRSGSSSCSSPFCSGRITYAQLLLCPASAHMLTWGVSGLPAANRMT